SPVWVAGKRRGGRTPNRGRDCNGAARKCQVDSEAASPMRFAELTSPELRNVRRQRSLVLAPIAACEQHSLHLPTFTDTILVTAVAEGVEQRLPDRVLLLPTLWLGASAHHLRLG